MRFLKTLGVLSLLFVLTAGQAKAQLTVFGFENGVGLGLNDPPAPVVLASDSGPAMTAVLTTTDPESIFGIGQNDPTPGFETVDPPLVNNILVGGSISPEPGVGTGFELKFSSPIDILSFDFMAEAFDQAGASVGQSLLLDIVGVGTVSLGTSQTANGFWQSSVLVSIGSGFSADTWRFSVAGGQGLLFPEIALDNLQARSIVPEPGTLALFVGAGLPLLWRLRRRSA